MQTADDSDEPLPLTRALPPADPFPVEALGASLESAVRAVQAATQAPMALAANSVLANVSLATQAHADVELPTGQRKPISDFFLTIAASGERKTSSDEWAMVPVRERQAALREVYEKEIITYLNSLDAWKSERSKTLANKKLDYGRKTAELEKLGPEPRPPLHWLLTCDEPTIEGLKKLMVDGQPSMGIFCSEGGAFIGGHGFSPDAKLRTITGMSYFWDGTEQSRVRSGDGTTGLAGKRLTVHLQAQPNVAMIMLADDLVAGQGLLSRHLIAAPDSTQGTRFWKEPDPKHNTALQDYYSRIGQLFARPLPIKPETRNELSPPLLKLSEEARARWITVHDAVEKELGPGGKFQSTSGLAAKLGEHAARLAAMMTVYESDEGKEISEEVLVRAIKVAEYYVKTALRVHGVSQGNVELLEAETLLKWLQSKWYVDHGANFSLTDVVQLGPNSIRDVDKAQRLIAILERYRHITKLKDGAVIRSKKRRVAWQLKNRAFSP